MYLKDFLKLLVKAFTPFPELQRLIFEVFGLKHMTPSGMNSLAHHITSRVE